ncbi:MAG: penicillin-binding protein activator [Deltaproteobacteria bacterium]|nr:penicillin-binding protein activator [Deltaproteobacteria bacterium]
MNRHTRRNALFFLSTLTFFTFLLACQLPVVRPSPPPVPRDSILAAAETAYIEGRLDRALELYTQQVDEYPEEEGSDLALIRMASIYTQQGDRRSAVESCRKLLRFFPESPHAFQASIILAKSMLAADYLSEAREALDDADKRAVSSEDKVQAGFLRAELEKREGHWTECILRLSGLLHLIDAEQKQSALETIRNLLSQLTDSELERLTSLYGEQVPEGYIPYEQCMRMAGSGEWAPAGACLEDFLRDYPDHEYVQKAHAKFQEYREKQASDTRRIGCALPLSGPLEPYGTRVLNGVLLALNAFNPELREKMPRLIVRDTKGSPETSDRVIRDLAENEHVLSVIGPLGSDSASAAARTAQELGIPIVVMSQVDGVTEIGPFVFRNSLTPSMQVRNLIRYVALMHGVERFAVLYPDNEFGWRMLKSFQEEIRAQDKRITAQEPYDSNTSDFSAPVRRLIGEERWAAYARELERSKHKKKKPDLTLDFDALFIPDDYRKMLLIAPQLAFHDAENVVLMGTNLWDSPVLAEKVGEHLNKAVFVADYFRKEDDEQAKSFETEYERAYGNKPDFFAALGYDTMNILISLLGKGLTEDRTTLRDQLAGLRNFPGLTGYTSFGPGGEAEKQLQLLTVKGKRIVPVE